MREHLTTALDALGLLLIAAGLAAVAYRWIGWACLAVAGAIVLSGSLFAARDPKKPGER